MNTCSEIPVYGFFGEQWL